MPNNRLDQLELREYTMTSVPTILTGDHTGTVIVSPLPGKRLNIKGITLAVEGVQDVYLKGGTTGKIYLPLWGNNFFKSSTSNSLNIFLGVDEDLVVDINGAVANRTFVGISYLDVD